MLSVKPPESPFENPSFLFHFLSSPLRFLIQCIHPFFLFFQGSAVPAPDPSISIRLVCISDSHAKKVTIPKGDVLIHAGDLANQGSAAEIQGQIDWLASLPHQYKIFIAGNHDSFFDLRSRHISDKNNSIDYKGIHYLEHASLSLTFPRVGRTRQLQFYGAPQIPECGGDDFAFQYPRQQDAWSNTIPSSTDVVITHTPPRHHLDLPHGMGCKYLLEEMWRIRPKLHVFGHVHAGYGWESVYWNDAQRAYERICGREKAGFFKDLFDFPAWIDLLRVVGYGIIEILWTQIWRGESSGTLMINASLTYRSTGQLRNAPQIFDI